MALLSQGGTLSEKDYDVERGVPPFARFVSSCEEVRFADNEELEAISQQSVTTADATLRATTTPTGDKYFYRARTRTSCSESPLHGSDRTDCLIECIIGKHVQVYSNSKREWCDGYVEKVVGDIVTVAFQLPESRPNEWLKKALPVDHKDIRGSNALDCALACVHSQAKLLGSLHGSDTCFQSTSLPNNWTPEEQVAYNDALKKAIPDAILGDKIALYANRLEEMSVMVNLPRQAVVACVQVANPELKAILGEAEFWAYCRLVGHCLALLRCETDLARVLRKGRRHGRLVQILRIDCLQVPPPSLCMFACPEGESVSTLGIGV